MSYEKLRRKYRITNRDLVKMAKLRRKWAFVDAMTAVDYGVCGDVKPTDEQIEAIISEYLKLHVYNRSDDAIGEDVQDMDEAFYRVLSD